jgi:polar amino acid transport system permease protein
MPADYILKSLKYILYGCGTTLEVYALTVIFSVPLAVGLALLRISKLKVAKRALEAYSWVFRGTPLLLQLFFIYYGLSIFHISLAPMVAAVITFSLNYAAYLMEIFRSGIEGIDRGQFEAAHALGMNYRQTMRRIVLPQAVKRVLPPASNEAINLIKDTALVSVIGMGDLLRSSKEIFSRDFSVIPFVLAAAVYLGLTWFVVMFFRRLEKRFAVYD